jgi:Zn-dependent protease
MLGLAMAVARPGHEDAVRVVVVGVGYGALLYSANLLHSLGHVLAGRLVGTPVEAILMTSTRDVVLYAQPGAAAPVRPRVGRALGGPVANLAVGLVLILAGHWAQARWVFFAGLMNVLIALWTLMPVPSLDGWVIWRTLVR